MNYRIDLQALRAIAVMAVLLFHFDVPGFAGGFIGVDVFFVISGYLMLSIIAGGVERRKFSPGAFYWARARRIIPALLALCAAMLGFGWFWLAPQEFMLLGEHALSSALFYSNFIYKGEAGYFDLPSQYKWLLHTWSLSVEWQFYLLYPLLLMVATRWATNKTRAIRATVILLAVLSLGVSVLMSARKPEFAFFLLPTRIWEMAAGGLIYLYAGRFTLPRATTLIGMAMMLVSVFLFSSSDLWPGIAALLPVTGAMLFMAANDQTNSFTRNTVVQQIGAWSYSIYLWHWPLVVGAGYFQLKDVPCWQAIGIALSVALGALSYTLIERPTRKTALNRRNVTMLLALLTVVCMAAGAAFWMKGMPSRVSRQINIIDAEAVNTPPIYKNPNCRQHDDHPDHYVCTYGTAGSMGAILWGDSHAGALVSALGDALHKDVAYYVNQCPPIFNARLRSKTDKARCDRFERRFLYQVEHAPKDIPVVLVSRLSAVVHGANETSEKRWGINYLNLTAEEKKLSDRDVFQRKLVQSLCRVASYRPLYVVRPMPEMGTDVPKTMARLLMTGHDPKITLPLATYEERNAVVTAAYQAAAAQCGVQILDPVPYLCADGTSCISEYKGRPIYVDDDHISEYGNRLLIPMFEKINGASARIHRK